MKARNGTWLVSILLAAAVARPDDTKDLPAGLSRGDLVRVEVAGERKSVRATVESVTADELVLSRQGVAEPLRLNRMQLETLDVSRGRRSHWRKGAVIGFVPGALFFGLLGGVLPCIDSGDRQCFKEDWALTGALIGGGITASVGALIGLAFKTDRWERLHERKARVSLILAPAPAETRFGFSVSF